MSTTPASPADQRIPVYLLTGYLGSGKTSLLKAWLGQPELADSALVINELGEVGLDHQLLGAAVEPSAALVANACVCCSGLPGLAQALEELFWARLQRQIPRFPQLVIETTGLAEPQPVIQALQQSDLLRERYRLAGVITCLSAATADAVLRTHAEARAQLMGASLLVVTKTDLLSPADLDLLLQRLQHQMEHQGRSLPLACSQHASLDAAAMLGLLATPASSAALPPDAPAPDTDPDPPVLGPLGHTTPAHAHGGPGHRHTAQAFWWPVAAQQPMEQIWARLRTLQTALGPRLLRVKGRLRTDTGDWVLQLAPFEQEAALSPDLGQADAPEPVRLGLTVIVALPLDAASAALLDAYCQGSMVM